jgi:thiol-disulfide isomerase/thioredoxin
MRRRKTLPIALSALLLTVLGAAGCGSSTDGDRSSAAPDYATALAGSPAPLAALHRQENELLTGGAAAYEKRIEALRDYPVVTNVWASWCGPCREEFPILQKLSARYGKRVAFVGINSQDSADAAATYLESSPVPYPSYSDPDEKIAAAIGGGVGLPETAFYDRGGNLCYLKRGPYSDDSELEADVRRFALREEDCESA